MNHTSLSSSTTWYLAEEIPVGDLNSTFPEKKPSLPPEKKKKTVHGKTLKSTPKERTKC